MVEVLDEGITVQGYLSGGQRFSVRPAEDRQQHLVPQMRVVRRPIDIEVFGVAAVAPACQHVHPPGIVAPNGHVVGNDIHDQPHLMPPQFVDEPP